MQRNTGY